jgi:polysaccharide export outer membrane protein
MNVRRILLLTSLAGSLAACSTLPSSGPTGGEIRAAAAAPDDRLGMEIVEVDGIAALPAVAVIQKVDLPDLAPPPTDMVGPGDVLSISIYEAGVTLFGSSGSGGLSLQESGGFDPSVKVQTLPPARVSDDGYISVPYAGRLHVLGKTVEEIRSQIREALRGFSQNPQILVTMRDAITNSVIVSGEVTKPGRLVLQTNRETLSDVVALAGGYRGSVKDLSLRVMRSDRNVQMRLSDLVDNPRLDVRAYPGDRLMLVQDPRTYSVLGASGRVEQMPFSRASISLAEAIAASGGPNPGLGDPAAIFVFRYVTDANGEPKPVVYHVNMMRTGAYFLAQNFAMQDKDVLYFGNAKANQPSKMIQLISQLFSPLITVISAVQVLQNNN